MERLRIDETDDEVDRSELLESLFCFFWSGSNFNHACAFPPAIFLSIGATRESPLRECGPTSADYSARKGVHGALCPQHKLVAARETPGDRTGESLQL